MLAAIMFAARVGLSAIALLAGIACGRIAREPETDGRRILQRAAAALKAASTFEYDFVFGHPADPMGHVTGHTRMRRVGDAKDSWIRVTGHVHEQPQFRRAAQRFDYGLDAERARLADFTKGTYAEAARGAGANALAFNAVYGYLSEFIEAEPLWKELGSAREVAVLSPETVDGTLCDVVRTRYDVQGKVVEVHWSIARQDGLPRRGRWVNSSYAPGTMTFTLSNLRGGHALTARDFAPARSPSLAAAPDTARTVAIGQVVPAWELATTDGRRIGSETLLGKIVVLDFWNTWCFICRTISPETRVLERELAGKGVQFVGVNLFETGDAAAYWKQSGASFPTVLRGEALAAMLDVSGQPAVAVIDAKGRLRYVEVGATADRTAHIRRAIEGSRR
jgi:thiol-disulfide isomerase/thioredoxin